LTTQFYHWGQQGSCDVWLPRLPKDGSAAIAGYAFAEIRSWVSNVEKVPPRFNARPLQLNGSHRYVTLGELLVMQKAINDAHRKRAPSGAALDLSVGDAVEVVNCAPFTGYCGTIEKVRGTTCRVLMGAQYVTLPKIFLAHRA
jgi:hypothetical protein